MRESGSVQVLCPKVGPIFTADLVYCPTYHGPLILRISHTLSCTHSLPLSLMDTKKHRWSEIKWKMMRGWDEGNNTAPVWAWTYSQTVSVKKNNLKVYPCELLIQSTLSYASWSLLVLSSVPRGNDTTLITPRISLTNKSTLTGHFISYICTTSCDLIQQLCQEFCFSKIVVYHHCKWSSINIRSTS